MVEPGHSKLSVLQQCILLGISKSSFYYRPVGESEFNLTIMRIMDETHMESEGLLATSPAKSNYIRNNEKLSNDWGVLK